MNENRNRSTQWCLLLGLLLVWPEASPGQPARSNAAPVRLALVNEEASVVDAADLLTVEFSKSDGVQLLERAQIEKVYREQGLSAANKDYVKLGQVLGADGLLLLVAANDGAGEAIDARLLAVKPGVVIGEVRAPWTEQNAAQRAAWLARQFEPLLPKLRVAAKDAVPLSVVNLHAAVRSAAEQDLEQQLTVLTIERLSRQKALFVLERRRMELLSAEKALAPSEESAFWNGSYVLDGVLDRDGYSPSTVTLNARLLPPKGGAPIRLDLSGSRTNLPALVAQLADKLTALLKLEPAATVWNAADEAQRYFEEAKWAYRWNAFSEAAAGCEAAWALGRQTKDVAELRIRAYVDDGWDDVQGQFDLTHRLVSFGPLLRAAPGSMPELIWPAMGASVPPDAAGFRRMRRAMELFCQDFRTLISGEPNPGWTWYDLGVTTLEGGSLWLSHYYYTPETRPGQEEAIAAVQAAAREMAKLMSQHPAFTNDLSRGESIDRGSRFSFGVSRPSWHELRSLPVIEAIWGAYWYATPEQGLENYRQLLEQGEMPRLRRLFLVGDVLERSSSPDPASPHSYSSGGTIIRNTPLSWLCGWNWADRKRVQVVWHRFLDDLSVSADPRIKLEGLYLRCAHALTDAEHDRAFRDLLALVEQHAPDLLASSDNDGLPGDLDALAQPRTRIGFQKSALEARQALWKQLQLKLSGIKTRLTSERQLDERLKYLAGGAFDSRIFNEKFSPFVSYTPAEIAVLLPAVESCRSNLLSQAGNLDQQLAEIRSKGNPFTNKEFQHGTLKRGILNIKLIQIQNLESQLHPPSPQLAGPSATPPATVQPASPAFRSPSFPTNRLAGLDLPHSPYEQRIVPPYGLALPERPLPGARSPADRVPGPSRPPMAGVAPGGPGAPFPFAPRGPGRNRVEQGTDPASLPLTNLLEVTRFWRLPQQLPGSNAPARFMVVSSCFREGRLWVETRFDRLGTFAGEESYYNRGAIFSVDLDTFQSEVIALDPRQFSLSVRRPDIAGDRRFEVHQGWLYVSSADTLKRYSLRDKKWEDLPVPVHGHGRFAIIGDRLLLSTDDSILELGPDGKEARILASSRRRPAVTSLDLVEGYDSAPLTPGPQGMLMAWLGGRWYEQSGDGQDWKALDSWPAIAGTTRAVYYDDGIIVTVPSSYGEERMFAMFNGSREPELLLTQPADMVRIGPPISRPLPGGNLRPRWPLPEGVRVLNYPVCLEGQALWVFAGRIVGEGFRSMGMSPTPFTECRAVLFRLQPGEARPFELAVRLHSPGVRPGGGLEFRERIVFQSTPRGLVVASNFIPGVWFIPRADLAGPLQAWQEALVREKPAGADANTQ